MEVLTTPPCRLRIVATGDWYAIQEWRGDLWFPRWKFLRHGSGNYVVKLSTARDAKWYARQYAGNPPQLRQKKFVKYVDLEVPMR